MSKHAGGHRRRSKRASRTPVGLWLEENGFGDYQEDFFENGFEELQDIVFCAFRDPMFHSIVQKRGHQIKLRRLLMESLNCPLPVPPPVSSLWPSPVPSIPSYSAPDSNNEFRSVAPTFVPHAPPPGPPAQYAYLAKPYHPSAYSEAPRSVSYVDQTQRPSSEPVRAATPGGDSPVPYAQLVQAYVNALTHAPRSSEPPTSSRPSSRSMSPFLQVPEPALAFRRSPSPVRPYSEEGVVGGSFPPSFQRRHSTPSPINSSRPQYHPRAARKRTPSPAAPPRWRQGDGPTDLHTIFLHFCKFGDKDNIKGLMNTFKWAKFLRDLRLLDYNLTMTDADLIFHKVKLPVERAITFAEFCEAIPLLARCKFPDVEGEMALCMMTHAIAAGCSLPPR